MLVVNSELTAIPQAAITMSIKSRFECLFYKTSKDRDIFWERPWIGEQRFYKIMLRMGLNATIRAAIKKHKLGNCPFIQYTARSYKKCEGRMHGYSWFN